MGSLEEPQHGVLHFGTPDNSITAHQRGFFAFPSYKSVDKVSLPLLDARANPDIVQGPAGLDAQGFAFLDHRSALAGPEKWLQDDNIERVYLRECEDLIREVTGAKRAVASNCSLRRRTVTALTEPNFYVPKGSEIDQNLAKIPRDRCTVLGKSLDTSREPARIVHIDYSLQGLKDSARYCRHDIAETASEALTAEDNDSKNVPRYAAYSVWRPITTVHRDPLAVCDWRSVNKDDLVAIQYRNPSSINKSGEYIMEAYNVLPRRALEQKWYWVPEQRQDEVLIIKFADTVAMDSEEKIAEHCLHGSPILPGTEEEPPRESIEFSAAAVAASPFKPVAALHLGSFGFDTPGWVRDLAKEALDRADCNQYSPSNGRKSLRDALAKTYSPFLGWNIDPDKQVVVTTGAIEGIGSVIYLDYGAHIYEGILSAINAFVHPGDEVLIFEPFYDQFVNNVKFVGGAVKLIPLLPPRHAEGNLPMPSKDWKVDMSTLEAARSSKTKMLIMNSPHNPLGKVFSRSELLAIGDFCVKHNIIIISDEVYEHMSYVSFTRMAALTPKIAKLTLTVGSAGKAFFLTGWRVGWVIGHESLIQQVTRAHIATCFSTVSPFQEAVAKALCVPEKCADFWAQTRREMEARKIEFNPIWAELGLKYIDPEGGYFVIVDMSPLSIPEEHNIPKQYEDLPYDCHVVWFLTTVIGVAAIPCSTFTSKGYKDLPAASVRFGFGRSEGELKLAKERLRTLSQYLVRR